MSGAVTLDEQIMCVEREIHLRKKHYPRWVKKGQLTERSAAEELERMEAVRSTLVALRIGSVVKWCPRCERDTPTIDCGETCGICKLVLP